MVDTINCYNEKGKCKKCGKSPVEFIYKGDLTDDVLTDLCETCFRELNAEKNVI